MKQYKAVLIDWDDTIGDFIGAAKLALQELCRLATLILQKHRVQ